MFLKKVVYSLNVTIQKKKTILLCMMIKSMQETQSTSKSYCHIDYCFLSDDPHLQTKRLLMQEVILEIRTGLFGGGVGVEVGLGVEVGV